MNHNQRFCELAGICWHEIVFAEGLYRCSCGQVFPYGGKIIAEEHVRKLNPDFAAEPWRVSEVMIQRKDWFSFCEKIGIGDDSRPEKWVSDVSYFVDSSGKIDRTGKFRDLATEWMEGRK